MLLHLHVKNLALIDEIEVDFKDHLNILTGETGAGKSIVIDSINSALGAKTSKDIIRTGKEYALIELLFNIKDPSTIAWVREKDVSVDDNGELLITRKITEQGRSVQKINGRSVTSAMVKEIATRLLDIHGQHEHQSLLNNKKHLEILDQFCGPSIQTLKIELLGIYQQYVAVKQKLEEEAMDLEKRKREMAFLEFEINEIASARLEKNEDARLNKQYKRMANAKQITQILSDIYELTGSLHQLSATESIGKASKLIKQVENYDDHLGGIKEQLENIDSLINDVNRDIKSYIEDITFDEENFNQIEERLNLINNLKTKYGNDIEAIYNYHDKIKSKFEQLKNYEAYREELQEELIKFEDRLKDICKKMTNIRNAKGKEIGKKIKDALIDLNFLDVKFEIAITPTYHYSINGWDRVEFLISTNPGEGIKPLGKVASGGELSRIMLAIKSILASTDDIETLIFDEIDVGISGRTAQKVSEKLAMIAKHHQVICITHLPQIASMADRHFLIEKNTINSKTITSIQPLQSNQVINEIARLISGVEITETVVHSAKEMVEMANSLKEKFINKKH